MKKEIWITAKLITPDSYRIEGVYTTKELAIKNCLSDYHFIGLVTVDEPATNETRDFKESSYPLL